MIGFALVRDVVQRRQRGLAGKQVAAHLDMIGSACIKQSATTATPQARKVYRYVVVGLLAIVYTVTFMDRQILSKLAEPIRKDLGLSGHANGAAGGPKFQHFPPTYGSPV